MTNASLLRDLSWRKQKPEFADAVQELDLAFQHAARMVKAGKLTRQEADDFEGYLYGQYMEALPVDEFGEMLKDGRLNQLQALAGHDGTRNVGDVDDARKAVLTKIKADALDEAWLNQKIDSSHYAEESRKLGTSEDLDAKMADGDFDSAAAEMFASRNDAAPDHDNDLVTYLKGKYGDGPKTPENPPGRVIHENIMGQPPAEERRSATDANGITDLDLLADQLLAGEDV